MSKTPYQIQCRAEFDAMIEERNAAKRRARPSIDQHGPVTVFVLRPSAARLPSLAECHVAATALLAADPQYAALCARLDAELATCCDARLPDLLTCDRPAGFCVDPRRTSRSWDD